jgi:hypothetical protein
MRRCNELRETITRTKAQRVAINSLSGFEMAVPGPRSMTFSRVVYMMPW